MEGNIHLAYKVLTSADRLVVDAIIVRLSQKDSYIHSLTEELEEVRKIVKSQQPAREKQGIILKIPIIG